MNIDFEKIKQKKVRKFLINNGLDNLTGFTRMRAVCYNAAAEASYRRHFYTFVIKKDIDSVWNTYRSIHPREAWNGQMVSFGVQVSKKNMSVNYLNDPYSGMENGQILILNLRLLGGLLNIAVAHEVAEVNDHDHVIKLCYMAGGASEGSQWISLDKTSEGFTQVSHLTLYKSKSKFRDTKLYPRLHTKAISEFHVNVKQKAELIKG